MISVNNEFFLICSQKADVINIKVPSCEIQKYQKKILLKTNVLGIIN